MKCHYVFYFNIDDPNKVNGYVAYLYFIIMNFVTYFVMINLFQMVILELYTNFNNKDEYPIEKYNDMINKFKGAWNKYSSYKEKGYRIHKRNLTNFFLDLQGDISKGYSKTLENIKRYASELDLKM